MILRPGQSSTPRPREISWPHRQLPARSLWPAIPAAGERTCPRRARKTRCAKKPWLWKKGESYSVKLPFRVRLGARA
eukprot:15477636-Alexandrium_andersonii.AAC.1